MEFRFRAFFSAGLPLPVFAGILIGIEYGGWSFCFAPGIRKERGLKARSGQGDRFVDYMYR